MLLKIRITGARGFGPTPQPASARRSKQYPLSQGLGLRVRVGRRKPHPGATLYTFTYIYTHIHIYTHTHINIYIYTHASVEFHACLPGCGYGGKPTQNLETLLLLKTADILFPVLLQMMNKWTMLRSSATHILFSACDILLLIVCLETQCHCHWLRLLRILMLGAQDS